MKSVLCSSNIWFKFFNLFTIPWVINFKFPLQPHQKYYITQYEELGLHSLLRWKMIPLPHLYNHFSLKVGECTFWTWQWKGWIHRSPHHPIHPEASSLQYLSCFFVVCHLTHHPIQGLDEFLSEHGWETIQALLSNAASYLIGFHA